MRLANHRQERWKLPLPNFIEHLYSKSFGKRAPDQVVSIEERVKQLERKKRKKRERKAAEASTNVSANHVNANFRSEE